VLCTADVVYCCSNADRDAFVRSTAAKLGVVLPAAPATGSSMGPASSSWQQQQQQQQQQKQQVVGAGSSSSDPLSVEALEAFLTELRTRRNRLQGELLGAREAHRQDMTN